MYTNPCDPKGNPIGDENPFPTTEAKNTLVYIYNQAAPAADKGILAECLDMVIGTEAEALTFTAAATVRVIGSVSAQGIWSYTRKRSSVTKIIKPWGDAPHVADGEANFKIDVQAGDTIDLRHSVGGTINHLIVLKV